MTPCPLSRRRAAASSSCADQTPSLRAGLWPEQESGPQKDPAHLPGPARNTPDGPLPATHGVRAAAGWPDPAAKDRKSCASARPIISPRCIAVTGIWADSRASVESAGMIYVQQTPIAALMAALSALERTSSLKTTTIHLSWKLISNNVY